MVMTKKKASFCLVRCKTQPQQRSRVVLLLSGAVRLLSQCECFVFCNNKSWRHTHTHTHDRTQEGEGGGLASSPPTKSTNKKQKAHIYKGSSCCQQSCLSVCQKAHQNFCSSGGQRARHREGAPHAHFSRPPLPLARSPKFGESQRVPRAHLLPSCVLLARCATLSFKRMNSIFWFFCVEKKVKQS